MRLEGRRIIRWIGQLMLGAQRLPGVIARLLIEGSLSVYGQKVASLRSSVGISQPAKEVVRGSEEPLQ